jgi:signal peptidase complex subunit 1
MAAVLKQWLKKVDPPIDYAGQILARRLMYLIYIVGYALALAAGIALNNLIYTCYVGLATFAVSLVVVVPPWKFYRRNPLKFRKAVSEKKEE